MFIFCDGCRVPKRDCVLMQLEDVDGPFEAFLCGQCRLLAQQIHPAPFAPSRAVLDRQSAADPWDRLEDIELETA